MLSSALNVGVFNAKIAPVESANLNRKCGICDSDSDDVCFSQFPATSVGVDVEVFPKIKIINFVL